MRIGNGIGLFDPEHRFRKTGIVFTHPVFLLLVSFKSNILLIMADERVADLIAARFFIYYVFLSGPGIQLYYLAPV